MRMCSPFLMVRHMSLYFSSSAQSWYDVRTRLTSPSGWSSFVMKNMVTGKLPSSLAYGGACGVQRLLLSLVLPAAVPLAGSWSLSMAWVMATAWMLALVGGASFGCGGGSRIAGAVGVAAYVSSAVVDLGDLLRVVMGGALCLGGHAWSVVVVCTVGGLSLLRFNPVRRFHWRSDRASLGIADIQYWAAGRDCCEGGEHFTCGDAGRDDARAGLVLRNRTLEFYSAFVTPEVDLYAEAAGHAKVKFNIISTEEQPIFVRWVWDLDAGRVDRPITKGRRASRYEQGGKRRFMVAQFPRSPPQYSVLSIGRSRPQAQLHSTCGSRDCRKLLLQWLTACSYIGGAAWHGLIARFPSTWSPNWPVSGMVNKVIGRVVKRRLVIMLLGGTVSQTTYVPSASVIDGVVHIAPQRYGKCSTRGIGGNQHVSTTCLARSWTG
ncbi:unnamed protein product [Prorocentrum cordatum]|uniref:Uncharacterized protein n=1 Tax=Prorocentrum cordatum TaxID=2364126 RepID=A0ABN9UG64_9DINO|nr:unnamed protein product [Polarella glacialis]